MPTLARERWTAYVSLAAADGKSTASLPVVVVVVDTPGQTSHTGWILLTLNPWCRPDPHLLVNRSFGSGE